MKKASAIVLWLMCASCLYAAPATTNTSNTNDVQKRTILFKDQASYFYSGRYLDYTDGGFRGQSGSLEISITDKQIDINVLREGENNPKNFPIILTKKYAETDSDGNKLSVYKGFLANDSTQTPIYFKLGQKYAIFQRPYYYKVLYDFEGLYAPITSGTGSGFAINSNLIITNRHVVERNTLFLAVNENIDSQYIELEVVYEDPHLDLAILKSNEKLKACAIDRKIYDIGDEVVAYGYPQPKYQGLSLKATKGIISSRKGYQDDAKEYQIDAAIQPGNSGGPLAKGDKIIGIVVATLTLEGSQNVNYAIKSNFLADILDVLKIQNTGKAKPKDCTYMIYSTNMKDLVE